MLDPTHLEDETQRALQLEAPNWRELAIRWRRCAILQREIIESLNAQLTKQDGSSSSGNGEKPPSSAEQATAWRDENRATRELETSGSNK